MILKKLIHKLWLRTLGETISLLLESTGVNTGVQRGRPFLVVRWSSSVTRQDIVHNKDAKPGSGTAVRATRTPGRAQVSAGWLGRQASGSKEPKQIGRIQVHEKKAEC